MNRSDDVWPDWMACPADEDGYVRAPSPDTHRMAETEKTGSVRSMGSGNSSKINHSGGSHP
jgi:hypothetical protein